MDRLEWLARRQSGIGSSDAPCLVGLGYRTAADVYRSKTEPVEDTPPTGRMLRGIQLEPVVAQLYTEATGRDLRRGALCHSPQHPWQCATPDFYTADHGRIVETKTAAGFRDWGDPGTDQIPDGYRVQVQHQLGITGFAVADVAALDVINWELRVYHVQFDPELFASLTAVEGAFWDLVQTRTPPDPDWMTRAAGIVVPRIEKGKRIILPESAAQLCARRDEMIRVRNEADMHAETIRQQLAAMVGDAEHATAPGYRMKWVTRRAHTRPACEVDECRYLDIRAERPGKGEA